MPCELRIINQQLKQHSSNETLEVSIIPTPWASGFWFVEIGVKLQGKDISATQRQTQHAANVAFLSRVISYAIDSFLRRGNDNSGPGIGYMISTIVLDIILGFAAAMVVAWFSRHREFRADAGSA